VIRPVTVKPPRMNQTPNLKPKERRGDRKRREPKRRTKKRRK
jgi:hypothetical protein